MTSMTIEYRSIEGMGASIGRAGNHTVIADRPEGKASGTGLGFNGGELLALSLGGCFCNDVHYTAHELGTAVSRLQVTVTIDFDGDPLLAITATVCVQCELADGGAADELLARARERCTVANSLRAGVAVAFK
ncbi:OsmC family protein [Azospirillum sp. RWY-5-1]|uniref:OsmC family protein n=2 Tax=Azospirillum oleiclasticum TaxID=2735135 RepID=A0ABX2TGQ4_9PROT|nr:OsmC family protein [Azospirillum oleiclasticum]NYZ22930.1 OsmC family protein [Azospirillum oleiclasticum]